MHPIFKRLDRASIKRLKQSSDQATAIEKFWTNQLEAFFQRQATHYAEDIVTGRGLDPTKFDYLEFLLSFSARVMERAIVTAESEYEIRKPLTSTRLTSRNHPKGKALPRSLKGLFDLYEKWRKGEQIPAHVKRHAQRIESSYFKKLQSVFDQRSEAFRHGKTYDLQDVSDAIRRSTKMLESRAKMNVRTETTYFYNSGRLNFYDRDPDITHYLFVAVRDNATTKWCRTRQGLVYRKGSIYFERGEIPPPCHWNCRSEMLPLSPLNPVHLRLINDKSIRRENRRPEPLPPEWGRRTA